MKETNIVLSGEPASPSHALRDVAPLLLVSTARKKFSFISHPQRQLLRAIETIGLLDVFETPCISFRKDEDDDDDSSVVLKEFYSYLHHFPEEAF